MLIIVVKMINKLQKEKYLMLFMMEAKLGELEKKSYTLIKNGLNHSVERISSISSKIADRGYLRGFWKRGRSSVLSTNKKQIAAFPDDDEFRLSARDLAFTNNCFKLDEFDDSSNSQIPTDSFA